MNNQISDQELAQMVQSIAEQYAPSPASNLNFTAKRLFVGIGLLTIFIFFDLLLIKQITFSNHQPKHRINSHQVVPFENPQSTEPNPQTVAVSPPVVPTTNPVQIPLPPQPTTPPSLPHMLPLPIPDPQPEIRPLLPPTPFPITNNPEPIKTNPQPPANPVPDPPTNKELNNTPEEPESVIDIQLSQPEGSI